MDPDPIPPSFHTVGLLRFANGGRLCNQLYYTLQAHVRGHGSKYALNGDYWLKPLSYLGCGELIVDSAGVAGGKIHVESDPKQVLGRDFTMGDVTSFVRRFILASEAYKRVSAGFIPDQSAIAVHVRNTDYLSKPMFSGFDRVAYLLRALEIAYAGFVDGGVPTSIHVFSDDIDTAARSHDSLFRMFSSNVVYHSPTSAEDDLLRLAMYRNKVIMNSTFGTWAGYIGDVLFDRGTHVVVPSEHYTGRSMRCIADPTWDMVQVVPPRSGNNDDGGYSDTSVNSFDVAEAAPEPVQTVDGEGKIAVIWSTDGGNAVCLAESMRSFDMEFGPEVSFVVLTDRRDLSFGVGLSRPVTVIDPVPALAKIGLTAASYTNKRFKFACVYKLAIPLLDQLRSFKTVCSVDADTVVIYQGTWGLDSRRCWSFASLFDYPLRDYEVAGASDQWIDDMRCAHLVARCCPADIREECERRVWSVAGSSQKSYINVGVLLWNLGAIDHDFYVRRVQAFWRQSQADQNMFRWPEQDFVNGFMRVDAGLSVRFNCLNNDKYNQRYVCLMHFAGQGGKFPKMRERNQASAQARESR